MVHFNIGIFRALRVKSQTMQENIGALNVKLSPEELQEIRQLAETSEAANGARHPEWFPVQSFVDTPKL